MMNKKSFIATTVAALGLVVLMYATTGSAQGRGHGMQPPPPAPPGMPPGPDDGDDDMDQDDFGPPMFEMLDLTEAQEKTIKDILFKAQTKATPIVARIKLKAAEIVYLWSVGKPDRAKILEKQREIASLTGQAFEIRTVMFLDVYDALTPEQQQMIIPMVGKFLMHKMDAMEGGFHKMGKRPGHKCPFKEMMEKKGMEDKD